VVLSTDFNKYFHISLHIDYSKINYTGDIALSDEYIISSDMSSRLTPRNPKYNGPPAVYHN
jgi:hypothetical protein